jgi:membrane peptidoglycan carboxypeptidase
VTDSRSDAGGPRPPRRPAAPGPVAPARPGPPVTAPHPQAGPPRAPYRSGDMPLLTHDETGAASMARAQAVAVAERPGKPARGPVPPGPPGKQPPGPKTAWQRMRRWVWVLLGLIVIGPLLAFAIGWMIFKVPTADDTALTQTATFNFSDGGSLAIVRPENVNRVKVALVDIEEPTKQAVLAAEDRTFYSNPGFDIIGIGRAIFNQLTGGVGGGSTITQQYVKNTTGQDQATLWRKYKEVVISVKISKEQTKDQILENYLNTIYLGKGAYGMEAAAQAYFGKPVGQLSLSESALLAGSIQSPSSTDGEVTPAKGDKPADVAKKKAVELERSQARWAYVLDQMVQAGWVTPAQRAEQVYPTPIEQKGSLGLPGDDRYHIYERAVKELAAQGITDEQIKTEGLTVTTTVNGLWQKQLVDTINKTMKSQRPELRAAAVSIDPRTGAVVAYYGGSNGLGQDYAGESERQPGSAFKPFVFSAALQSGEGIGLGSVYDGSSGQVLGGRKVNNSEGVSCGQCTVQTAMTQSINTVFYRMGLEVGPAKVVDAAHQAGIPADLLPVADGGISLGDQEVHPIDMASAYATFSADGLLREPYIVQKVVAADGRVLIDRTGQVPAGKQVMTQQVARNVTESMIDVAGSSGLPLSKGRPVAAKTGTVQLGSTNDNKDTWTVGYTPSLSTAVWVGTDQSDPVRTKAGRPAFGRTIAGPIWQKFMNAALADVDPEQFSDFEPMGAVAAPPAPVATEAPPEDSSSSGGGNNGDNGNSDSGNSDSGNGNSGNSDSGNGNSDSNNSDSNNSDTTALGTQPRTFPGLARPTIARPGSSG